MSLVVMKFGGTSVADLNCMRNAARRVKAEIDAGNRAVVAVSAMAGVTNKLIGYVSELSDLHGGCEADSIISSGEQISSGLLALALHEIDVPARSWLAWQVPIETDGAHGKARIKNIDPSNLLTCLDGGEVPIVAGFQGIDPRGRLTTLGRGGSDTSAVALAAALKADQCDIYTDVDGVYTSDPRIVTRAQKLEKVTYEEMLEMASLGARVLQTRSVELAMNQAVRLQVRSSFEDSAGTFVVDEDEIVEQQVVSGITYSRDEAKITLVGVHDRPGAAAAVFGPLANANINVDMIVQSTASDGNSTDITFTVLKTDFEGALAVIKAFGDDLTFDDILTDQDVVKVSVIGVGMRSYAGVAQKMFETLAEKGINIQVISTSEIKISVLIAEEYTELALRALHAAYQLDAP
ncbi:MAG: aspartate kinase [Rhodospirillaceae bacterium]|nr:aspartate kinase [Rhodospirillaceae bacterium]